MMDFMEISKKRTTVRKFAQRPVEEEKLQKILEAGRWSPTAVNAQPQRILVLDQPVCMLYIGYPADDFVPNTHLGGHRKPLHDTCFRNSIQHSYEEV